MPFGVTTMVLETLSPTVMSITTGGVVPVT